jgi:predicted CoA-binding protein
MKTETLVLGASENPDRYSNMAVKALIKNGYQVKAIGNRKGKIGTVIIHDDKIPFDNIHTVTLYLSPKNQLPYYQYIMDIKPDRIIFNPGTENEELRALAQKNGIQTEEACTLVLLSLNEFGILQKQPKNLKTSG